MDPQERIRQLEKLLESQDDDHLTRFLLGRECLKAGDPTAAAVHLRRCVELAPDYTAAWRHLGDALKSARRTEEALKAYDDGQAVAERTRDMQAGKEMRILADKLRRAAAEEDGRATPPA